MVKVTLSDNAGFSLRVNIDGITLRKKHNEPVDVSVISSLVRLSDPNLMFVFEESDREELMSVSESTLALVSRELKHENLTHEKLAGLLLPAKKKTTPKKKTTSKAKSSLASK